MAKIPLRFYIATRLERHQAHNLVRDQLTARGWECSYDWTVHGSVKNTTTQVIERVCEAEIAGVESADLVIVLLPGGRGTHVELGIAIGARVPVILHALDRAMFQPTEETCAFYHGRRRGVMQVDPGVHVTDLVAVHYDEMEALASATQSHRRGLEGLQSGRLPSGAQNDCG